MTNHIPKIPSSSTLDSMSKWLILPPGVSFLKLARTKPYIAQASINGRKTTIGYFNTPEEAGEAYLSAIKGMRPELES